MNITASSAANKCTGCGACAVVCPQKCISMGLDSHGFYSPSIRTPECTECGACVDVCYKFLTSEPVGGSAFEGMRVLAAIDVDREELLAVSSGGVANRIAVHGFEKGHRVCGVRFDPRRDVCEHVVALDGEDLKSFRTSKYVQSRTFDAFSAFEKAKPHIVFGTPCQIFGLRRYLRLSGREADFTLVDFFCRGVPSLLLWNAYKDFVQRKYGLTGFRAVNFKDKTNGWHKFSMRIVDLEGRGYLKSVYDDLFWSFYLKNTCFNEACYDCRLRHDAVYSDIRVGDFWGEKYYSHEEGVSLVVICTPGGERIWEGIRRSFYSEDCETQDIYRSQRFDKYPKFERYADVMRSLVDGKRLEDIDAELGLSKQGFYRGTGRT